MSDIATYISTNMEVYKRMFYHAHNPVFGTGIAINATPTVVSATEGMINIFNSANRYGQANRAGRSSLIVPQYIRLTCKTAATGATDFRLRFVTDNQNRWASGGTPLTVNETHIDTLNGFARRTPWSVVNFGDLTLNAASSEAQVGEVTLHAETAGTVLGDQYTVLFGNFFEGSGLVSNSAAGKYTHFVDQVVLGPQCSLTVQPVMTSASAGGTYEVSIGLVEMKRGDRNN